jgi:hypothetical protein
MNRIQSADEKKGPSTSAKISSNTRKWNGASASTTSSYRPTARHHQNPALQTIQSFEYLCRLYTNKRRHKYASTRDSEHSVRLDVPDYTSLYPRFRLLYLCCCDKGRKREEKIEGAMTVAIFFFFTI